MEHDWAQHVKKYATAADDAAIKGIIKHCGIALQNRDASLVACSDKAERDRVRDSFLKKSLVSRHRTANSTRPCSTCARRCMPTTINRGSHSTIYWPSITENWPSSISYSFGHKNNGPAAWISEEAEPKRCKGERVRV